MAPWVRWLIDRQVRGAPSPGKMGIYVKRADLRILMAFEAYT